MRRVYLYVVFVEADREEDAKKVMQKVRGVDVCLKDQYIDPGADYYCKVYEYEVSVIVESEEAAEKILSVLPKEGVEYFLKDIGLVD